MPFQESGGGALFGRAAEPKEWRVQIHGWGGGKENFFRAVIGASPAHGVVVLGVAEAGGFQLAAHHGAGALVAGQVPLQATLAVYARS